MIPGEYFISDQPIIANENRKTVKILVTNTGDRPIQVGSHTHFFEVNKALSFTRKVELVEYAGKRIVFGFSGLVNGNLDEKREDALSKSKERGFKS